MTIAARIRELHAEGKTPREIADAVGRAPGYVHSVLSQHRARVEQGKNDLHPPVGRPKKVFSDEPMKPRRGL